MTASASGSDRLAGRCLAVAAACCTMASARQSPAPGSASPNAWVQAKEIRSFTKPVGVHRPDTDASMGQASTSSSACGAERAADIGAATVRQGR